MLTPEMPKNELRKYHSLFYALAQLGDPIWDENVQTASVTYNSKTDSLVWRFNPNFYSKLTDEERAFVVAHEAMHLLLDHPSRIHQSVIGNMTPEQLRHRDHKQVKKLFEAYNVSADVVVNETLKTMYGFDTDKMPHLKNGIVDYDFFKRTLPDGVIDSVVAKHNRLFDNFSDGGLIDEGVENESDKATKASEIDEEDLATSSMEFFIDIIKSGHLQTSRSQSSFKIKAPPEQQADESSDQDSTQASTDDHGEPDHEAQEEDTNRQNQSIDFPPSSETDLDDLDDLEGMEDIDSSDGGEGGGQTTKSNQKSPDQTSNEPDDSESELAEALNTEENGQEQESSEEDLEDLDEQGGQGEMDFEDELDESEGGEDEIEELEEDLEDSEDDYQASDISVDMDEEMEEDAMDDDDSRTTLDSHDWGEEMDGMDEPPSFDDLAKMLNEQIQDLDMPQSQKQEILEEIKEIGQEAGNELGPDFTVVRPKYRPKPKWETIIKRWISDTLEEFAFTADNWFGDKKQFQWMSLQDSTGFEAKSNKSIYAKNGKKKSDKDSHLPTLQESVSTDGLLLPGEERESPDVHKLPVVLFLDTSGSCIDYAQRFINAARTFPEDRFDVTVYGFTTIVYPINLRERNPQLKTGGTRFDILETTLLQLPKYPKAVFVITDGWGNKVNPKHPDRWYWFVSDLPYVRDRDGKNDQTKPIYPSYLNPLIGKCKLFDLAQFE